MYVISVNFLSVEFCPNWTENIFSYIRARHSDRCNFIYTAIRTLRRFSVALLLMMYLLLLSDKLMSSCGTPAMS